MTISSSVMLMKDIQLEQTRIYLYKYQDLDILSYKMDKGQVFRGLVLRYYFDLFLSQKKNWSLFDNFYFRNEYASDNYSTDFFFR